MGPTAFVLLLIWATGAALGYVAGRRLGHPVLGAAIGAYTNVFGLVALAWFGRSSRSGASGT